jgi:mono/diheme cytochrome c family protein
LEWPIYYYFRNMLNPSSCGARLAPGRRHAAARVFKSSGRVISRIATGAAALALCAGLAASPGAAAQSPSADAPPLTPEAAKALKNPIPNTSQSIGRGKGLYGALGCVNCHGTDAKALIEVVANATDLTDPKVWKNGTEEGMIFRSLRDGAGLAMPPFKMEVTAQDDLWHLVNFIRNLWPAALRPPVAAAPGA